MHYQIEGVLHEVDDGLIGGLSPLWERTYLHSPSQGNRITPMLIRFPFDMECETTITWPAGYQGEAECRVDHNQKGVFFQRSTQFVDFAGGVRIKQRIMRSRGKFRAQDYAVFLREEKDTMSSLTTKLVVTKVK